MASSMRRLRIRHESYLAVTCYFIDGDNKKKLGTIFLGVQHFPGTHTAEKLALARTRFMEEWGIKDKSKCIVADAAANMIACINNEFDTCCMYCSLFAFNCQKVI